MKITTVGVPRSHRKMVLMAISMTDRLVWGGQMNKKIKQIKIFRNSSGNLTDPPLIRGIKNLYNPKTKICELHIEGLISMGNNDQTNLAWSVCHDLAHTFDIVYGNLSFNKDNTINYLGKNYNLNQVVNTAVPEEHKLLNNYRDCLYYQAHDYYEPWEVRALMAADACMSEYRRDKSCPNLIE